MASSSTTKIQGVKRQGYLQEREDGIKKNWDLLGKTYNTSTTDYVYSVDVKIHNKLNN